MTAYKQWNLTVSLQQFLRDKTGIQADIVYDGYVYSSVRPLITIEQMQNNYEYNVKGREAVETIYRWQVGLHASNLIERGKRQEEISNTLIFNDIPYFDYEKSANESVGFFDVEINAVTPMPADDIAKHSVRHTVYFDVELNTYKRGC